MIWKGWCCCVLGPEREPRSPNALELDAEVAGEAAVDDVSDEVLVVPVLNTCQSLFLVLYTGLSSHAQGISWDTSSI